MALQFSDLVEVKFDIESHSYEKVRANLDLKLSKDKRQKSQCDYDQLSGYIYLKLVDIFFIIFLADILFLVMRHTTKPFKNI